MKTLFNNWLIVAVAGILIAFITSCKQEPTPVAATTVTENTDPGAGQANVIDDVSQKDIVKVAMGSPDHTTLVTAIKAADLVNALSNAGPFTVFAPTNAAFNALPAGTVDNLLKPENKDKLADILQYHVTVSVYETERLTDGLSIGQVNGGNVKISRNGDKIKINDANIIATIRASNGVIHVIDKVLLPQ